MANYNWNTALITGGGSGLGRALAELLIRKGKKVIIAGRTEGTLKQTASEIGAAYLIVDVGKLNSLESFVKEAVQNHPEIDCVVANAGIQKPINYKAESPSELIALSEAEIDTNIKGSLYLIYHFLPHLLKKQHPAVFTVSSGLAYVPLVRCPVYSATKAFIHSWTQSFRSQVGDRVRVIEIIPPLVGTNLHRDFPDPDDNKKHKNPLALTIEEFIRDVDEDMNAGKDEVAAGFGRTRAAASSELWAADFARQNGAH
ncbi:hypothetical protein BC832DRAFT_595388 [Gaertneriomyces semiglobifer]|nr:hypothetical protein BC832DRAFT_595388 [Gaertneriomyces semiglobifer]